MGLMNINGPALLIIKSAKQWLMPIRGVKWVWGIHSCSTTAGQLFAFFVWKNKYQPIEMYSLSHHHIMIPNTVL